jgi:two-component system, chemotaxis family, response regulator Rcp1
VRSLSIFMIDDSLADAALYRLASEQSRMPSKFTHFEDGQSALAHLRETANELPDLILLDLNMPGLSGHEVLNEIRADSRLMRLPVLVLSSSEDQSDIGRSYDEYVNGYLVKPVGGGGFQEIIDSIEEFWSTIVMLPPSY